MIAPIKTTATRGERDQLDAKFLQLASMPLPQRQKAYAEMPTEALEALAKQALTDLGF